MSDIVFYNLLGLETFMCCVTHRARSNVEIPTVKHFKNTRSLIPISVY